MFECTLPTAGMDICWPAIILMGCFIGFLTGLFGVGGGFLLTPVLKVVFGVPYPIAVGSGLASFFCTASLSAYQHEKKKHVDFKLGACMTAGALIGTAVGRRFMTLLSEQAGTVMVRGQPQPVLDLVINTAFVILLTAVAVFILIETSRSAAGGSHEVESPLGRALQRLPFPPRTAFPRSGIACMSIWVPLVMSFFIGILTGLLGVGGGFVNFPLLVYVIGIPTVMAVGTSSFQIVFASGFGALLYLGRGQVDPLLVGMLLVGSFAGTRLGVWVSHRLGGRHIRRYFAVVLFGGVLLILYDFLRMVMV